MTTQLIGGYESATGKVHPLLATADGKLEVNTTGGGGGTQFDVGDALGATPTGTLLLARDASGNAIDLDVNNLGELKVRDPSIAQGYDAQIASGGDGATQILAYGRDSSGNLDALKVDNNGHLEVIADYEQKVTSVFSGTQAIGASASHQFSTPIDKNGASQFEVLVSISTSSPSGNINIDVSDDDTTYYSSSGVAGNIFSQNSSANFIGNTSRYAKVTIENTGTSSMTVTSVKATHINGL